MRGIEGRAVSNVPRVPMREPYGKDTRQIDEFAYEEGVDGKDHSKYLWGNAADALAGRLTNSFCPVWLVRLDSRRGKRRAGGGAGPTINFRTDEGDVALKCPTEVAITDRREKELADQGFVPLVHHHPAGFSDARHREDWRAAPSRPHRGLHGRKRIA